MPFSILLGDEIHLFLDQETKRILYQHGIVVTKAEIIRTLIAEHRIRVMQAASEDEALLWFYHRMEERENELVDSATRAANLPAPRKTRIKKRKRDMYMYWHTVLTSMKR
jgi:hypothetical protein